MKYVWNIIISLAVTVFMCAIITALLKHGGYSKETTTTISTIVGVGFFFWALTTLEKKP